MNLTLVSVVLLVALLAGICLVAVWHPREGPDHRAHRACAGRSTCVLQVNPYLKKEEPLFGASRSNASAM